MPDPKLHFPEHLHDTQFSTNAGRWYSETHYWEGEFVTEVRFLLFTMRLCLTPKWIHVPLYDPIKETRALFLPQFLS